MLQVTRDNSITEADFKPLNSIVYEHQNVFRISFSSGRPHTPPRIDLTTETAPLKCRLCNYLAEQRDFMQDTVTKLKVAGMVFRKPTAGWEFSPLIVSKPGRVKFSFTVDLRAVNRYTIRNHYPMPVLEQELAKRSGCNFFCKL